MVNPSHVKMRNFYFFNLQKKTQIPHLVRQFAKIHPRNLHTEARKVVSVQCYFFILFLILFLTLYQPNPRGLKPDGGDDDAILS